MSVAATQQQPAAYRLVVADELGQLKVIEVPAGPKWDAAAVVSQWGSADKGQSIQRLACLASSSEPGAPALLAVGRKGGKVELWDASSGARQCSLTVAAAASGANSSTSVVALEFIPADGSRPLQLAVGTSDGTVSLCSSSSSEAANGDTQPSSSGSWVVSRSFSVGSSLACLAVDDSCSHIVVGGEGMQPGIWDLSSGSKVWQGKGGKPNRVGLVDKPNITALAFLPSSGDGTAATGHTAQQPVAAATAVQEEGSRGQESSSGICRRFVAGSAQAKLHVYDTAAGKRPQQEAVLGSSRITALAVDPQGKHVWAADGTGHMQLWVLATNKLQDALKGAGGSVRALAPYPGPEPWLASVGLDRFLRIHDASSKAGKARVYLKQQLTAVAWLPIVLQQQSPAAAVDAAAGAVGDAAAAAEEAEAATSKAGGERKRKKTKSKSGSDEAAVGSAGGKRRKQGEKH